MEQALTDAVFALARIASAAAITGAAAYIAYHQWFTQRLRPTIVWNYVGIVLSFVAIFRWFVVFLLLPESSSVYHAIEAWLAPMTQTGYILLAMCFIVLTRCRIIHEHRVHPGGWPGDMTP